MWMKCPKCKHKLFWLDKNEDKTQMEVKCSSCKSIVNVFFGRRYMLHSARRGNAGRF